jgi:hypothetical protein
MGRPAVTPFYSWGKVVGHGRMAAQYVGIIRGRRTCSCQEQLQNVYGSSGHAAGPAASHHGVQSRRAPLTFPNFPRQVANSLWNVNDTNKHNLIHTVLNSHLS